MNITEQNLREWFLPADIARGKEYFRKGKVQHISVIESENTTELDGIVSGTEDYYVEISIGEHDIDTYCDCPRFEQEHSCKHVVAVLCEYLRGEYDIDPLPVNSDYMVHRLISAYSQDDSGDFPSEPQQPAQLIPVLERYDIQEDSLLISLRIGRERKYVVKSIQDFLHRMYTGETYSYGKKLTLRHSYDAFTEESQKLIRLLAGAYQTYLRYHGGYYYYERDFYNTVTLSGNLFDSFFSLYLEQWVMCSNQSACFFTEESPLLNVSVSDQNRYKEIRFPHRKDWGMLETDDYLYIATDQKICRCSSDYRKKLGPILDTAQTVLRISDRDLSAFCSVVLPEIREYIVLDDPQGIVNAFSPEPATACYYFDLEAQRILCRLKLRYGDREYQYPLKNEIQKPNVRVEQLALKRLAQHFFIVEEKSTFFLNESIDSTEFLMDILPQYRQFGEVYVSESLQNMEIKPRGVSVGLSVSDGMLTMELDTGGFPVEELEALYDSLLRRKKYHRLSDGRFLRLNGSQYESLAEVAHMTQLDSDTLTAGTVVMPAYRALYLNKVLGEKENLNLQSDQHYRDLIRQFHNFDGEEVPVPDCFREVMRGYQETGFRWMKMLEKCGFGGILADEMGLGKTLQAISYLSTVPYSETGKPSLVVCPASLVLNWADEFQRFAPQVRVCLFIGNAKERKAMIEKSPDADVWVTSYDLLKRDISLYETISFYCCILDEAQFIKNQTTLASKAVKRILCQQRFVLTGTPIENRLSELWNLFDFLMPGYLFSHHRFVEKLEKPIIKSKDEEAQQQLRKLIQPFMLRRLKQDVLQELPPKMEHVHRIQMSESERKVYYATVNALKESLSGTREKLQILAGLTRLRQICCDPGLCYENYSGETSKLEACMELIRSMTEGGHQVLLFSQFTSMLDRIRAILDKEGITSFTLEGSTPKARRAELVKAYNAGGAQVFLISLKAGGTGLNLTAADVVIHYDPWWNLAAQNQATDRAHRIGQVASVHVYKLIAGDTIEEKILALQDKKAMLMDSVSTEGGSGILSMTPEEMLALLD